MKSNSKFKLWILSSNQHTNNTPAETYNTHRTNLLLLLNKWQQFLIDVRMDHFDCKLSNKVFYLFFSDSRVFLVKHVTSKEVSHVNRVSLVSQFITNLSGTTRIKPKDVIDKHYDFITLTSTRYINLHTIDRLNQSSIGIFII